MAATQSQKLPATADETAISMRGIGKFFGKTRVLENIDLEIKRREFCVFVGPSGCGKSTLLRLIAGLESPSAGDLRPSTIFAAGFLGSPKMNFLRGTVGQATAQGATINLTGGGGVTALVHTEGIKTGDPVTVGIRPEHIRVTVGRAGPFTATVQLVEDLGDHSILHLDRETTDGRMLVKVADVPTGEEGAVSFDLPPDECHIFDSGQGPGGKGD